MAKQAVFTPVDLESWERKEYFDYFYNIIKCKYTLNVNIDITDLQTMRRRKGLRFFPTMLYPIMRAVNQNKEFRMSFENNVLGYWSHVVPAYTLFHEDNKTFSDVWSDYHEKFSSFYKTIAEDIETYKDVKKLKAREGRLHNFCSISSVPWLSFASYSQDTYTESNFLFPLIRFGKYFEDNGKILLPFAVFVNHAVADGYHTSKLINEVQDFCSNVNEWMIL